MREEKSRKNRNLINFFIASTLFIIGVFIIYSNWGIPTNPHDDRVNIIEAASIITMDKDTPRAKYIAYKGDTIIGLANDKTSIEAMVGDVSFTYDNRFTDKILMPGLIDPHVHPMQAAVMLNVDFIAPEDWELPGITYKGAQTRNSYITKLKELVKRKSDEELLITWGHHHLFHGEMDRAQLDEIAPELPVIIWQRSFHEIIMNSKALEKFDLSDKSDFEALMAKANVTDGHGNHKKGIFSETALLPALGFLRPYLLAPKKLQIGFGKMQQMMLENGVTTISDMATGIFADFDTEAGLIKKAFGHDKANSRVMLMRMSETGVPSSSWLNDKRSAFANDSVMLNKRVKLFADGAFFAQNMRMNPPGYDDGHVGKWLTQPAELAQLIPAYWNDGWDLHIHVNGDEGLDVVLSSLEKLDRKNDQTITLEHLGYSTEAQNARIAKLNIMVSAQPNYIRVLGDKYAQFGLGEYRASHINRLGSLEQKNVPLGLHSDFNMAPIDPLYLAWIASNRETLAGNSKAPDERISLEKALRAITIEAAQVIGLQDMIGSLSQGKKSDMVVLEQDPYELGVKDLDKISIEGIIYEGRYIASK